MTTMVMIVTIAKTKKILVDGVYTLVNLTACELENHQLVKLGKPSCLSSINVLFSIATT